MIDSSFLRRPDAESDNRGGWTLISFPPVGLPAGCSLVWRVVPEAAPDCTSLVDASVIVSESREADVESALSLQTVGAEQLKKMQEIQGQPPGPGRHHQVAAGSRWTPIRIRGFRSAGQTPGLVRLPLARQHQAAPVGHAPRHPAASGRTDSGACLCSFWRAKRLPFSWKAPSVLLVPPKVSEWFRRTPVP